MKAKVILSAALFMAASLLAANDTQKHEYQSLFMYNFLKHIKWPEQQSSFTIGVYDSPAMFGKLSKMAMQKKQINGTPIHVKPITSAEESLECNLIFVPEHKSKSIGQMGDLINNKSVVIVSEKPGQAQHGSDINFKVTGGKIRFELNMKSIESKGMKVSTSLADLAEIV